MRWRAHQAGPSPTDHRRRVRSWSAEPRGAAAPTPPNLSGEVVPEPGDRVGLRLNTANNSRLDYVEISITNSASYGINAIWQSTTFNGPDLTARNTFQSNARGRQTYNGLTPPGTCPIGGGCPAP